MRIALIAPGLLGRSGWSRYALDLARALAAEGHDVSAVVWRRSAGAPCPEKRLLPKPRRCLSHPLGRWVAARRVAMHLKQLRPDVVHFMAEPYALLLPLMGERSWRTVLTLHGSYAVIPLARESSAGLARRALAAVDAVVSVSEFTKDYLRSSFPDVWEALALERKVIRIPNGVPLPALPRARPVSNGLPLSPLPLGRPARSPGEPRRILGVGAVKSRKGFLEAVEACDCFAAASALPFRYDIVGSLEEDPRYVARLRQRIRELGLGDRVFLRGLISDEELQRAYAEADLFLLLSLHQGMEVEGFGLVFLEASARGVPVIGPSTGGCPEAIDHGRSGYVCDPGDAAQVAERMREVLEMGAIDREACRAWAEAHDVREVARRLLEVYGHTSPTR